MPQFYAVHILGVVMPQFSCHVVHLHLLAEDIVGEVNLVAHHDGSGPVNYHVDRHKEAADNVHQRQTTQDIHLI